MGRGDEAAIAGSIVEARRSGRSDGSGWFVGWADPGEWTEHAEIRLAAGRYRFTARVAADAAQTIHLEVDGDSLGPVIVGPTAGWDDYVLVHLGSRRLDAGAHDLRLVADTGNVNLDWIFVRRS